MSHIIIIFVMVKEGGEGVILGDKTIGYRISRKLS